VPDGPTTSGSPKTPRPRPALRIGFFGGGALLVGGWLWGLTGVEHAAASAVTLAGFVVMMASATAIRGTRTR
jgi:hypothetical protein